MNYKKKEVITNLNKCMSNINFKNSKEREMYLKEIMETEFKDDSMNCTTYDNAEDCLYNSKSNSSKTLLPGCWWEGTKCSNVNQNTYNNLNINEVQNIKDIINNESPNKQPLTDFITNSPPVCGEQWFNYIKNGLIDQDTALYCNYMLNTYNKFLRWIDNNNIEKIKNNNTKIKKRYIYYDSLDIDYNKSYLTKVAKWLYFISISIYIVVFILKTLYKSKIQFFYLILVIMSPFISNYIVLFINTFNRFNVVYQEN